MRSRFARVAAICIAAALLVTLFPLAAERLVPPIGFARTFYPQIGFRGAPIEATASEINLRFLDERTDLPRQNFSTRWRGFIFLDAPQTMEFFAGGNDEVQLRVDGQVLITRNLRDGMRTIGRKVPLGAGAHELIIEFQQFGGSMALNIQRAMEGQPPAPFPAVELFSAPVQARHVRLLDASRLMRRATPWVWGAVALLLTGGIAAANAWRWRKSGAPANVRDYVGRLSLIAAPAALAPAVVFLIGPHTIFTSNPGEFAVPFGQIAAPWLVRAAGLNWLVLLATGCLVALISQAATRMLAAVLFVFGLLLWGQGNLWNADYGVLAGRDVDLAEHASRAPYETAILAGGLVLAAIFFRPISRIAPFAALVFLGLQAAGAVATGAGPAAERARWIDPPADIYGFSRTRNIIHIVLDEFQSDVFGEILQTDRADLDRQFSGFTYFSEHAGAFPTTSMSMPAMLTGLEYRNDRLAPEFIRDAFKRSSIFDKVSRAGFDVDVMSIVPIASLEDWIGTDAAPNWKGSRFRIRKPFISQEDYREVSARQLAELSLFRHVPHSAKVESVERPDAFYKPIWMDRGDSPAQIRQHEASNSVAFLEHFIELMGVTKDQPVYKLLHVGVPHRPVIVDRECRFIGPTAMSRDAYREQSRCAVRLVAAFLDRTRALGIYDSSLIIVSSDHGTDLEPLGFNGKSDSLSLVPGPSTWRLPVTAGSAKAIMFIKPPDSTGPIAISEAPTTHIDLQATVLDIMKLPGGSADASMFNRDPKQPRTRIYGMYDPRQRFPKAYLDRLDLLAIDGRVADAAAWHLQQSIWPPTARFENRDVDIGPREAHRYLGPGWSFEQRERASEGDEVTFARALTPKAVLYASLPAGAVDIVLRASASPASPPVSVNVQVDGKATSQLKIDGESYRDLLVNVPADSTRPHVSEITLHVQSVTTDVPAFKLDRMIIRPSR